MEMGGYRTNVLDILMLTGIYVMNGSSARMAIAALRSVSPTEMPEALMSVASTTLGRCPVHLTASDQEPWNGIGSTRSWDKIPPVSHDPHPPPPPVSHDRPPSYTRQPNPQAPPVSHDPTHLQSPTAKSHWWGSLEAK